MTYAAKTYCDGPSAKYAYKCITRVDDFTAIQQGLKRDSF